MPFLVPLSWIIASALLFSFFILFLESWYSVPARWPRVKEGEVVKVAPYLKTV